MKILYLLLTIVNSQKIIKNMNTPSCRNCIHYKPSYSTTDFTTFLNKCDKFGDKNIITNKISYDYADTCRRDEDKCGNVGKYFEIEKNIELKILTHQIISNIPSVIYITILSFIIINTIKKL
jgi:hypothetical protein